jgi:hypothetical protein
MHSAQTRAHQVKPDEELHCQDRAVHSRDWCYHRFVVAVFLYILPRILCTYTRAALVASLMVIVQHAFPENNYFETPSWVLGKLYSNNLLVSLFFAAAYLEACLSVS